MGVLPTPGRTGVRIAGDMYQWLIVWQGCLTVLRDNALHVPNPVVTVGVEVDNVGNLDDVVLRRIAPPHTYGQVKYAVDSTTRLTRTTCSAPIARVGHQSCARLRAPGRR